MSEETEKPAKKKVAAKKEATPKPEVLYACTVIEDCQIGCMKCAPGAKAKLPEDKAKALEKLGKIRIDGVA